MEQQEFAKLINNLETLKNINTNLKIRIKSTNQKRNKLTNKVK